MPDLSKAERELAKQLICRHEHCRGGNDYLSCDDCGLEWGYGKSDPVFALQAMNNRSFALRAAERRVVEAAVATHYVEDDPSALCDAMRTLRKAVAALLKERKEQT